MPGMKKDKGTGGYVEGGVGGLRGVGGEGGGKNLTFKTNFKNILRHILS